MKVAGHTMGTPEYTLDDAIKLFADIGLDGVEIVVQDDYKCGLPEKTSVETLKKYRALVDSLGLEVSCLTPYFSRFNSSDAKTRQHEIDGIKDVIGYAEILGAHFIRIYGGNTSEIHDQNEAENYLVESMQMLGDEAKKFGIKLVIENHFNTMTVSAKESIGISNKLNHQCVGILYDQANLIFTGKEDFKTAIDLQKEKIYYTHVKDLMFTSDDHTFTSSDVSHPKEEERKVKTMIVGEGIIEWQDILQMLKDNGYDGWLSLEYERRWHPNDIPDASVGMKKSGEFIKQCLENLK